jgi:hypothetical protein
MPSHTKPKSHSGATADSKPKTKSPAAGGAGKTRSAVTGRQLGRAAIRSLNKNADRGEEYLHSVLSASSLSSLQALIDSSKILARVTRATGAGRLVVTLQTGETEVSTRISGTLRFKGAASRKTDRENCMCVNDIILVDGGSAASKLSPTAAGRVKRVFAEHGYSVPAGFFARAGDGEAAGDEEDDGFDWDRSDEEAAEIAEEVERKAEEARKAIVRAGGAGRGGAPKAGRGLAEAIAAAAEPVAEERVEDDGGFDLFSAGAAPAAAAVVDRTGPNRAERRAAAAAAAEAAAATAVVAAERRAWLMAAAAAEEREAALDAARRVVLPVPNKSWEELADEIDVDAI